MVVLLKIGGNCLCLRAKVAHMVGHLLAASYSIVIVKIGRNVIYYIRASTMLIIEYVLPALFLRMCIRKNTHFLYLLFTLKQHVTIG